MVAICSVPLDFLFGPRPRVTQDLLGFIDKPLQQLGRGLVADSRDARDVVGGVALEPIEVGDLLGRDAVAVDHRLVQVRVVLGAVDGGLVRRPRHGGPVVAEQDRWMEEVGRADAHAIAMVEAALILEAGAEDRFDCLVVVTCRPEQRAKRWAQRLHLDEETARREVTRRMAAQWPDEEKVKAADYVIDNSGSLDQTERQVREVLAQLKNQA